MGTRSLTFIHDGPEDPLSTATPRACVYQQYDGYFDGVGLEIQKFLAGSQIVNGIGMNGGVTQFNGAGDLAARLITQLKGGDANNPGGVYIEDPTLNDGDMGTEYAYHIYCVVGQEPYIRAVDVYTGRTLEGPASEVDLSESVEV